MNRRHVLAVVAIAFSGAGAAQEHFPTKPVRIVVPTTAGGGTDFLGRTIATKLGEKLGWTVVVDNRPGATGTLALGEIARQRGDGHELVMGLTSNVSLAPILMKLSFDPLSDLVPVAHLVDSPLVAVVPENAPYRSWKQFADTSLRSSQPFTYGTTGNGSGPHVAIELLKLSGGLKLSHVPYKSSSLAITDLIGGHIDMAVASAGSAIPLLQSGRVRALAVTTAKRSAALPQVPSFAELGYSGFEQPEWYGLFASKGVSPAIADLINAEINKILALPEVQAAALSQGMEVRPGLRPDFAAMVKADAKTSRDVIQRAGIKPN